MMDHYLLLTWGLSVLLIITTNLGPGTNDTAAARKAHYINQLDIIISGNRLGRGL